jgi:hypothetical protein
MYFTFPDPLCLNPFEVRFSTDFMHFGEGINLCKRDLFIIIAVYSLIVGLQESVN